MSPIPAQNVVTFTIPASFSVSAPVDFYNYRLGAFIFPPAMDGQNLTFRASATLAGPYVDVMSDGILVSVQVVVDTCDSDPHVTAALAPLRFLQVVSDATEPVDRVITVITRQ